MWVLPGPGTALDQHRVAVWRSGKVPADRYLAAVSRREDVLLAAELHGQLLRPVLVRHLAVSADPPAIELSIPAEEVDRVPFGVEAHGNAGGNVVQGREALQRQLVEPLSGREGVEGQPVLSRGENSPAPGIEAAPEQRLSLQGPDDAHVVHAERPEPAAERASAVLPVVAFPDDEECAVRRPAVAAGQLGHPVRQRDQLRRCAVAVGDHHGVVVGREVHQRAPERERAAVRTPVGEPVDPGLVGELDRAPAGEIEPEYPGRLAETGRTGEGREGQRLPVRQPRRQAGVPAVQVDYCVAGAAFHRVDVYPAVAEEGKPAPVGREPRLEREELRPDPAQAVAGLHVEQENLGRAVDHSR